jgi:[ribosomal protein S5]-alanine N-acetyltransferase
MNTPADLCTLRPWREGDQQDLVRHVNNRKVWLGLRDRFPHPYTLADAEAFLARVQTQDPLTVFAIAARDRPFGGIGLVLGDDVERISAEIGYWLGEEFWGRGIATAAVLALTRQAFATFELNRLFAVPYADNAASIRVLVKAGYRHEGTLLAAAIKDGQIRDQELFAITRQEAATEFSGSHG